MIYFEVFLSVGLVNTCATYMICPMVHEKGRNFVSAALVFKYLGGMLLLNDHRVDVPVHSSFNTA